MGLSKMEEIMKQFDVKLHSEPLVKMPLKCKLGFHETAMFEKYFPLGLYRSGDIIEICRRCGRVRVGYIIYGYSDDKGEFDIVGYTDGISFIKKMEKACKTLSTERM